MTRRLVPLGTRRRQQAMIAAQPAPVPAQPAPPPVPNIVDDLDVLIVLYGQSLPRAAAVARTFARWRQLYRPMPRVLCAWCYKPGNEPGDLAKLPAYPWLEIVRLPEYDLDDNLFRKEGLLNLLIREYSSAPHILALDADVWCEDPLWFARVRALLAADPDCVLQPYHVVDDTGEPRRVQSWSSQTLPGVRPDLVIQPGLGWGFTRDWAMRHPGMAVFNPWLVTGSGDCMFVLEHFPGPRADLFRARHTRYRYFRDVFRRGLPSGHLACVDATLWHENHTDRSKVPLHAKDKPLADRAYVWSRQWLDRVGPITNHIHLDDRGVPMPIDPDGPFVRVCRRKPELQSDGILRRVLAEEFGANLPTAKGAKP